MQQIRIELKTDMCASSGMSAGNCLDNDLSYDSFGLPVIPGRRLKGVIKQAAERLLQAGKLEESDVKALFGSGFDDCGGVSFGNAEIRNAAGIKAAITTKNAEGNYAPSSVIKLYTYTKAQTSMENGVSEDTSLRYTRVLSAFDPIDDGEPLVFYAPVKTNSQELFDKLALCCKAVRHMGLMRNRGLGWVKLSAEGSFCEKKEKDPVVQDGDNDEIVIPFTVMLDSGLVLPGCSEQLTAVPGRTIIGCMASAYIRGFGCADPMQDEVFRDLFLTGKVKWSDLTPRIDGRRSVPAPLMLGELKHENRIVNRYNEAGTGSLKRVDGMFAAQTDGKMTLGSVREQIVAHFRRANAVDEKLLYSVASIPSELLYCGTVTLPARFKELVFALLSNASLRLGGSKNAQYSQCRVIVGTPEMRKKESVFVRAGEPLFVVLLSDMLLMDCAIPVLDNDGVRNALASELSRDKSGAVSSKRNGFRDYVGYHTVGGYNAMWHLQKRQQTVICGGSVFSLTAEKDIELPRETTIGQYLQEGFGQVRILTGSDMRALDSFKKSPVDRHSRSGEVNEAFIAAAERNAKRERIPERALELYQQFKKKQEQSNKPDKLVNGRVRLMTEQALDLRNLKERLESIKSEGAKGSAIDWYNTLFADGHDEFWRELALAVLHLHYYDKSERKEAKHE